MISFIVEKYYDIIEFDFVRWIHNWSERKLHQRILETRGTITECTWCGQNMQEGLGCESEEFEHDEQLDVMECGVCGGTSLWVWGFGFQYVTHLDPPEPKFETMPGYDHLREKYHGTYQIPEGTADTMAPHQETAGSAPIAVVDRYGNIHRGEGEALEQETSSAGDESATPPGTDGNR